MATALIYPAAVISWSSINPFAWSAGSGSISMQGFAALAFDFSERLVSYATGVDDRTLTINGETITMGGDTIEW